jgi:hypothetical protein
VAALALTAFPSHSYAASIGKGDQAGAYGKIAVSVKSAATGQDINNAAVLIYDQKGNVVVKADFTTTDSRSFAVPAGQYKVVVMAQGFETQSQAVSVDAGEGKTLLFSLKGNSTQTLSSGTGGK